MLKIPGRRYYTLLGIIPEDRYFTLMRMRIRMCISMIMSMNKLTELPSKLTKLTKLPPNQNKRFKQRKEVSMNKQPRKSKSVLNRLKIMILAHSYVFRHIDTMQNRRKNLINKKIITLCK